MKQTINYILLVLLIFAISLVAQESAQTESKSSEAVEMPVSPPQPLNDDWSNWLVGEWIGTSETTMGNTKDWMKIAMGLNNQFLIMTYKSKPTGVTQEMIETMAKQYKAPVAEIKKMMETEFEGMGLTTVDPKTGDMFGYWFDSYRDVSRGEGVQTGNTNTMTWKSKYMEIKRTVEKIDKDNFTVIFSGKDITGQEYSGLSKMTRKK